MPQNRFRLLPQSADRQPFARQWLYIYTVEFDVCPFRRNGMVIPKWQRGRLFVRGRLVVEEVRDPDLHRMVRVGHIFDADRTDLLLPLYDVLLVSCKPDWWTFTGYERQPSTYSTDQVCYQQSWVLIPATITDAERAKSRLPPPLPPVSAPTA